MVPTSKLQEAGDQITLKIEEEDIESFRRLDQFLSTKLPELSRSLIRKLYDLGQIYFDDNQNISKKIELKKMPPAGAVVVINIPPPIPANAQPEDIPLEVIYEDEYLIFINKPAGMVTHPAPGNYTGTLVNAILHLCHDLKGVGCVKRPGIVHRLDKGTSGIMVVAKTQKCHEGLVDLFSRHDIDRKYEAIVVGNKIDQSGTIESFIDRNPHNRLKMCSKVEKGKKAITHFRVLNYYNDISSVELTLETGRTHQIRVHLSEQLNRAILCDSLYGNPTGQLKAINNKFRSILKNYEHPLLHAKSLGFVHPITKEKLYFEQFLPEIFQQVYEVAERKDG